MDTSVKSAEAGKRQFRSLEEKLRIVEEASRPGASVAAVALRNGVNANLVFGWRRLHRRGLLERQREVTPRLLPVKVTMPTLTPSARATLPTAKRAKHLVAVTHDRRMPPWKAEPGHGEFLDTRRLTDTELKTLAAWAATGAKEGDPKDLPAAPKFADA